MEDQIRSESALLRTTICYWQLFFVTVSITGAPVEDNTASDGVRTVATICGCKILQLYEYEANEYGYEATYEWYPKNTSPCCIKDKRLSRLSLSALSGQYMIQN